MQPRKSYRNLAVMFVLGTSLFAAMPATAQSEADCAARADRAAKESSSALGGAVAGGAGGAAFGAIVSDKSRKGAKRGAALGAIAGGATAAHRREETYRRVYDNCMAGR
jgi:hypothetical protein